MPSFVFHNEANVSVGHWYINNLALSFAASDINKHFANVLYKEKHQHNVAVI